MPCFCISLPRVNDSWRSTQVMTKVTPFAFIAVTWGPRGCAYPSESSKYAIWAVGYFANEFLMPAAQSFDCCAMPYASTPTLVAFSDLARNGCVCPAQVKQI